MFRNREDAAQQLAAKLLGRELRRPLVLAIPRGGVALGAVLAKELGADLDVILARKLRAPGNPELALGAAAETGQVYLNPEMADCRDQAYIDREIQIQRREIARRRRLFRRDRQPQPAPGRSVILVDDGVATGSTMMAALHSLRNQHAHEIVVAVPVADPQRLRPMRSLCDDVICLVEDPMLRAVGHHYEDFSQLDDADVAAMLEPFCARGEKAGAAGRRTEQRSVHRQKGGMP
jgi:predicted phosphoribosyltransferase